MLTDCKINILCLGNFAAQRNIRNFVGMENRKNKLLLTLFLLFLVGMRSVGKGIATAPYRNPKLPVSQRVADLLGRMTLEEKVGQLRCALAWDYWERKDGRIVVADRFKKDLADGCIGMLWATYRADPWTRKSLTTGLNPADAAKAGNALQRYNVEHTRLGIPLFLAEEAPHGHMAIGTTVFPTGLGLAATWNPRLAEQMGQVVGREVRLQGGHISYGPVMDLSRDPRWSRVEESMGEDPVLTARMGAAVVHGLGGGNLARPYSTIATLKHFIGYGTTEGGQNGSPTFLGEREIRQQFLYPFRKAIEAGAQSVMTSYNSLDGVPSTMDDHYLRTVLRGEWGFRGFVVSDLYSVDGIYGTHHVAPTLQDAAAYALRAGVDADLGAQAYATLVESVRSGKVDEALVDSACARILRLKMEMGLFENPYVDPEKARRGVRTTADVELSRQVARESVTLLKNEHSLLPLSRSVRVAVVGPNADNRYNLLGDYTAPQPDESVVTILEGIRSKLPAAQVEYVKGCSVRDTTHEDIAAAVAATRRADVVVVAVGGSSARDFRTNYQATGAAEADTRSLSDMDCGEGYDRATLGLLGLQDRLLRQLKAVGKPMVVVYIEGRPLDKTWAAANADALLTAYYPGGQGGQAIADVLFGDYNPAGRLPVSVPTSVGQIPVYYNKKAPMPHDYVEMSARPLYAFGYGLSYTTFDYHGLKVSPLGDSTVRVEFDVTNTGARDGDEVAQLYLRDRVASVAQPSIQLKAFERAGIPAGTTRHFVFTLGADDLAIVNRAMRRVVEPGEFTVMVGSSSDRILLKGSFMVNKAIELE